MKLDETLAEVLRRAPLPLTAVQAVAALCAAGLPKLKKAAVQAELQRMTAAGQVTALRMAKSTKAAPAFTTHSPQQVCAEVLKAQLHATAKPVKIDALRKRLPEALRECFPAALQMLMDMGAAFLMPPDRKTVSATAPCPTDLLTPARRKALAALLALINQARRTPRTLDDLLAWLDAEADAAPALTPIVIKADAPVQPGAAEFQEWYEADVAGSSTTMIPVPQTWRRFEAWAQAHGQEPDIQGLRSAMIVLYNEGRILLEPCERPQDLPENERALLMPMALGPPGYFWRWLS